MTSLDDLHRKRAEIDAQIQEHTKAIEQSASMVGKCYQLPDKEHMVLVLREATKQDHPFYKQGDFVTIHVSTLHISIDTYGYSASHLLKDYVEIPRTAFDTKCNQVLEKITQVRAGAITI